MEAEQGAIVAGTLPDNQAAVVLAQDRSSLGMIRVELRRPRASARCHTRKPASPFVSAYPARPNRLGPTDPSSSDALTRRQKGHHAHSRGTHPHPGQAGRRSARPQRRDPGSLRAPGFKLVGLKLIHIDRALAETHYAVHREKPFFGELVEYLSSRPVVAAVLEGPNAIEVVRAMIGKTPPRGGQRDDPRRLRPGRAAQPGARLGRPRDGGGGDRPLLRAGGPAQLRARARPLAPRLIPGLIPRPDPAHSRPRARSRITRPRQDDGDAESDAQAREVTAAGAAGPGFQARGLRPGAQAPRGARGGRSGAVRDRSRGRAGAGAGPAAGAAVLCICAATSSSVWAFLNSFTPFPTSRITPSSFQRRTR